MAVEGWLQRHCEARFKENLAYLQGSLQETSPRSLEELTEGGHLESRSSSTEGKSILSQDGLLA